MVSGRNGSKNWRNKQMEGREGLYMKEEEWTKNPFVEFQEPAWLDCTCLNTVREIYFLFCWVNDLSGVDNDCWVQ